MANTDAVVYVFLGDAGNVISLEDVKEWLQIMDEVVDIKLQYDVTSRETCYAVEFRRSASAQQAVQYLNGSRLKNCVVRIRSRVFSAPEAADASAASSSSASAPRAPVSGTTLSSRKRCRETAELPLNHLLPEDLQMDQLLVEHLSDASKAQGFEEVTSLWSTLKSSQEALLSAYRDLDKVKEELGAVDAQLAKLLHVRTSASDGGTNGNAHDTGMSADAGKTPAATLYSLAAHRCISHNCGIPLDAYTPSSVVSFVTRLFGPVAFFSVSASQGEMFVVLRFVFMADEERFLAACSCGSINGHGRSAAPLSEKERALLGLVWARIDFTVTPRDFAVLSPAEGGRQEAVRRLLC
jgi:hypothetical protein